MEKDLWDIQAKIRRELYFLVRNREGLGQSFNIKITVHNMLPVSVYAALIMDFITTYIHAKALTFH